MRLRTKLILMLWLIFLMYIGLAYSVVKYVVSPVTMIAEQEFARWDAERAVLAIQREADHLSAFSSAWAHWDETSQFASTGDPTFVAMSLEATNAPAREFDFIYWLDDRNQVLWKQIFADDVVTSAVTIDGLSDDQWPTTHPLLNYSYTTKTITGIIMTSEGPSLIASSPIFSGDDNRTVCGAVVTGKFLGKQLVNRLKAQTHVMFALEAISDFQPPDQSTRLDNLFNTALSTSLGLGRPDRLIRLLLAKSIDQTSLRYYGEGGSMIVLARLRDIYDRKSLVLRVDYQRVLTVMGIGGSVIVFSAIVLLGMIMSVILLIFVYLTVTRPITHLNKHVAAVSSSPDLSLRLSLRKSDEIGVLAREYNHMLERLEQDDKRRRVVEDELKKSEARYRSILSTTAEGFCQLNRALDIEDVNDALCQLLGYWRKEMIGRSLCEFVLERDKPIMLLQLTSPQNDHSFFEATLISKKGKETPFIINASAIRDDHNTLSGQMAFLTDITELKKAEALKEDVERITRHDMKTPLMAIISFPQIMKNQPNLTTQQTDFLERIENAGYRLLNMINLSLDLYKMEKGSYKLKAAHVDLLPIIRRITTELSSHARAYKVDFALSLRGEPVGAMDKFIIQGDELLCYTMLANLLKNAMEASPPGEKVNIDLDENDAFVVQIHNKGAIPFNNPKSFFEKYATAGKENGTGLGAYSAKLITETHCGTITCVSSDKDGTTITINLPRESMDLQDTNDVGS